MREAGGWRERETEKAEFRYIYMYVIRYSDLVRVKNDAVCTHACRYHFLHTEMYAHTYIRAQLPSTGNERHHFL